jgi:hypothetical protein
VYSGAAGAIVVDATGQAARVDSLTAGAGIYLRLSNVCNHGATLGVPPADATVDGVARTTDHGIALVGLRPKRNHFVLTARRGKGHSTTITVDISGPLPPAPS